MPKKDREKEFIEKVYAHQGILQKISAVYAANKADRDDLKQEMVMQLWKSYPTFKGNSKFSTWMYRVSLNTAITFTRKASWLKGKTVSISLAENYSEPEENSDELKLLYKAIVQLNKVERAIILMWLDQKSYLEISEVVGISVKNVSVRLVRIKEKLSNTIKGMN